MPGQKHGGELTPKQLHFARCVAAGMTQTEAYVEAYDCKSDSKRATAASEGHRLAVNPKIAARIKRLIAARERAIADSALHDRDRVLSKLRTIMASGEGGPAEASQLRAAELLGKSVGLFRDVIEQAEPEQTPEQIAAELADIVQRLRDTSQEQSGDGTDQDGIDPDDHAVH